MPKTRLAERTDFLPLPKDEPLELAWPTGNRTLFKTPEFFTARTRINPSYGMPGWTRDCGKRFHRGCDIAPLATRRAGVKVKVVFTDCATGKDFVSDEPVLLPGEDIYAAAEGIIFEVNRDEAASDFGIFVVIRHTWPKSGKPFYSLYAHLAAATVAEGDAVEAGGHIGVMGNTSRNKDAKNWMLVAPHLHFEVWNESGEPYDPLEFLRIFLAKQSDG